MKQYTHTHPLYFPLIILIFVVLLPLLIKEHFSMAENVAGERLNNNVFYSVFPSGAPYWDEISNVNWRNGDSGSFEMPISYYRRTRPRYLYEP